VENKTQSWQRGFWSLIVTQFQGAFSDNVHKQLVQFIVVAVAISEARRDWLTGFVGVLFASPFILFSMTGGWLADRFSKRSVTIGVKVLEIAVMGLATVGLALVNVPLLLVCVFLMSLQSALFGPSKYGLMPELLPEKELSWGNGIMQLGTNVAIVTGIAIAGWLSDLFRGSLGWCGVILAALAMSGTIASLGINRTPAADPRRRFRFNFLSEFVAQWRVIRSDRVLKLAVLGELYFGFLGSLLLFNILIYGKSVLHCTDTQIGLSQAAVAIGIGVGSLAAGYLSGRKIEYGLIPIGTAGIAVCCLLAGRAGLTFGDLAAHLAALGFFAGFFIVPIGALVQHRPPPELKGAVLGANNTLAFTGVMLASGAFVLLRQIGLTPPQIFVACGLMTLAGTAYALWLVPDSFLRLVLWVLTHSIYRIKVNGRDNIPERGGALFVCNHVSFVDALLVQAATDRPLRCIMFKDIYEHPVVKPFAKMARHIPISSQQRPREMIQSLRIASEAIKNGEVIVIFAEGQITRIGQLLPFRRGFERIMKTVDAPIVPICLDNVWGSIFSFEKGRFLWKVPRFFPYPVTVSFGKPMPATATPFEVRQAVQDLNADAWDSRRKLLWPIHRAFVRKAQHYRWRFFMADGRTKRLNFGSALTRTIFLARRLRKTWSGQEMVGILMPPSVGGALVNLAAMLSGKVPVNLNYTANDAVLASCAQQCNLKTVITSRQFLEKVKLNVPAEAIYLEDLAANPGIGEKLAALAMSWLLPPRAIEQMLGDGLQTPPETRPKLSQPETARSGDLRRTRKGLATLDTLATIIFSSGSTGDPKGVMLTHWNIRSNVEQLGQTFAFNGRDKIVGILPFFHSFGFTATIAAPAVLGCGVVFHPSPLDARAIGALVREYRCTFLLATPTFLQMYLRSCEPEDFGSLQFVVTGAEKLADRLAQAFEDKFGLRPLEAYGCTECSPAVAVNTHDFRAAGFRQVGAKRGKIGHPLPGMAIRIVDADTRQPLPVGQAGLMLVRGPNVMAGYLEKPDKTAEVLRDGWYATGDVAAMDEDGFLQITDRLSRFSKIGGEMVPHIKVEEKLHELAGATEQCFVVTSVPDEKKGERLVVLHTAPEIAPVTEKLAACDLPNLWKPRADQFFRVDSLPYLGTGKLDLRRVKELAAEKSMS
jgi:acyl-[acyl-carrier-protein]-phospholipid O-acyltransferase/long-chain-fatty-acid--[acyl-carrier-protein] ligase